MQIEMPIPVEVISGPIFQSYIKWKFSESSRRPAIHTKITSANTENESVELITPQEYEEALLNPMNEDYYEDLLYHNKEITKSKNYLRKFIILNHHFPQKNRQSVEWWYMSKSNFGMDDRADPSKIIPADVYKVAFVLQTRDWKNTFLRIEEATGRLTKELKFVPFKKPKISVKSLKREPYQDFNRPSLQKLRHYKALEPNYFRSISNNEQDKINNPDSIFVKEAVLVSNYYINDFSTDEFWNTIIDKFNIKFSDTHDEKMRRREVFEKRRGMKKNAETFETEGKVGKNKWLQAIYDAIYDENDPAYKIMYQQQGQYGYPISTSHSLIEISMTQKALADGKKPPTERQVKNGMLKSINEASGKKLNPKGAKDYGVATKASYEYNGKRFFVRYTVQKPLRGLKEPYELVINGEEYFENPMLNTSNDDYLLDYEAESFEANDMVKERYFDKQIKKYKDKLDWYSLSFNPALTPAIIEKYEDKWNWKYLSSNTSLTPAIIEKYEDKLDWSNLSANPSLTPALIEKYIDKLGWENLSFNTSLTPAFIEKYEGKMNWMVLSQNPALTPALIEKYKDKLNWRLLSENPSLTPALIEKYIDKLNLMYLSQNPALTPALIEKYKGIMRYDGLSRNPSLTPAFIEKYEDEWNWSDLSRNPALTPALIDKYIDKLDWDYLSLNPSLTPAFIEKHKDKLRWMSLFQNPALFGNLHVKEAEDEKIKFKNPLLYGAIILTICALVKKS